MTWRGRWYRCGSIFQPFENPTSGVRLLDEGGGRMRVITWEEERAYVSQTRPPLKDVAQILLETGMRPEEVFRMEAANISFDRRTIYNPCGKTKAASARFP